MYRELKFRFFDKVNKAMIDPSCNVCLNPLHTQLVPMQFTGLKDQKGRDIYEGDVLKERLVAGNGKYIKSTFVVTFINGQFVGVPQNFNAICNVSIQLEDIVIGNIFEKTT